MSQIDAAEFKELISATSTPDGAHGLFKFATEQGEITVALPAAQFPKLMAALSDTAAKNARIQTRNPKASTALTCSMWSFDADPGSDMVNMTFRIPGGMEMTFLVSKKQVPLMKDALSAAETGQTVIPAFGKI